MVPVEIRKKVSEWVDGVDGEIGSDPNLRRSSEVQYLTDRFLSSDYFDEEHFSKDANQDLEYVKSFLKDTVVPNAMGGIIVTLFKSVGREMDESVIHEIGGAFGDYDAPPMLPDTLMDVAGTSAKAIRLLTDLIYENVSEKFGLQQKDNVSIGGKTAMRKLIEHMVRTADRLDDIGLEKIARGLDDVMVGVVFEESDRQIVRVAGEKIDYREWEVNHDSLQGSDWALNVSRGEESENENPVLVKIQDGIMTVRYKDKMYKSGIQFKSEYFYSDKFKNSIARAFRGLVTGKVSFTHVEEMYDLEKVKDLKGKKVKEKDAPVRKRKVEDGDDDPDAGKMKSKPNRTEFVPEEQPEIKPEEQDQGMPMLF